MIDEDLRTARQRARRWDQLDERRRAIADRALEAGRTFDALDAWDQETILVEEARLDAFATVLAAVERELAELGPARELYEELLTRKERRLVQSADPRGAELLEMRRLLAELDVELPARERARTAGLAVGNDGEGMAEFVRQLAALGMSAAPQVDEVPGWVERLELRCEELARLRDELRERREGLLLE
ncbi:hypothetical protein HII36_08850 [Nonomuraea sp. NN258]|uniref:hypothetical protein n=1 Tax=Nonomuraea antri TaxID=2730852 RepID=UPI001567E32B|nr:hypothetical protein [Nonomuraea antri]NRQ31947.1 hypothetical protein [Nonomuraea antri]